MANTAAGTPNRTSSSVTGSNSGDTVSYTFNNVAAGDLIQSAAFGYLGVQINQERVRRGSSANAAIKDSADYAGTIDYAEMEKLRSSIAIQGSNPPTYSGNQNGTFSGNGFQSAGVAEQGAAAAASTFTFTRATASFAGDPGTINASGSWTGKPKITADLFNTIIQGLKNQGAECVCNCNYCTCNCNYCTCNCNFSCTCNCNYSDVTTKNNIVYM